MAQNQNFRFEVPRMEEPKGLCETLQCPKCDANFFTHLSERCAHKHFFRKCSEDCRHYYCYGGCWLVDRQCPCGYVVTARMLQDHHKFIVRYLGDFSDMPSDILEKVIAKLPDSKLKELSRIFEEMPVTSKLRIESEINI